MTQTESVSFAETGTCPACGCTDTQPCGHWDCRCWEYPSGSHHHLAEEAGYAELARLQDGVLRRRMARRRKSKGESC